MVIEMTTNAECLQQSIEAGASHICIDQLPQQRFLGAEVRIEDYKQVLACLTRNDHFGTIDDPALVSIKILSITGCLNAAIDYIRSAATLDDAYVFSLPTVTLRRKRLKVWQALARKYIRHASFRRMLSQIGEIELYLQQSGVVTQLSELRKVEAKLLGLLHGRVVDGVTMPCSEAVKDAMQATKVQISQLDVVTENTSLQQLQRISGLVTYRRSSDAPDVAVLFAKYKVPEVAFNEYIDLDTLNAGTNIPDISVDGGEIGYPGYYFMKLPATDSRAAILGCMTHCCQSIHAEGRPYVLFGLQSPNAGFYVLCKGNVKHPSANDTICAQSFVWRAHGCLNNDVPRNVESFVFDSIEYLPSYNDASSLTMIKAFYDALAHKMVELTPVEFVGVGDGGQTPGTIGFKLFGHTDLSNCALDFIRNGDSSRMRALAVSRISPSLGNAWRRLIWCQLIYLQQFSPINLEDVRWAIGLYPEKTQAETLNHLCMLAAVTNQCVLCEQLIPLGADVKEMSSDDFGLPWWAIEYSNLALLHIALKHGCQFSDCIFPGIRKDSAALVGLTPPLGTIAGQLVSANPSLDFYKLYFTHVGCLAVFENDAFAFSQLIKNNRADVLSWLFSSHRDYTPHLGLGCVIDRFSLTPLEYANIFNNQAAQVLIALYDEYESGNNHSEKKVLCNSDSYVSGEIVCEYDPLLSRVFLALETGNRFVFNDAVALLQYDGTLECRLPSLIYSMIENKHIEYFGQLLLTSRSIQFKDLFRASKPIAPAPHFVLLLKMYLDMFGQFEVEQPINIDTFEAATLLVYSHLLELSMVYSNLLRSLSGTPSRFVLTTSSITRKPSIDAVITMTKHVGSGLYFSDPPVECTQQSLREHASYVADDLRKLSP